MNILSGTIAAATFLAITAQVTPSLADGPFGIDFNSKIEAYPQCKKDLTPGSDFYLCSSVPRPHPDFSSYMIIYSETLGICGVGAVTKMIDVNSFGTELIALADDISSQLSIKYGKPKKVDYGMGLYSSPEYWMLALKQNERTYAYLWNGSLPDGIKSIQLSAQAEGIRRGDLTLVFRSANAAACLAEQKKAKAKAF
ncbi:MAG: hypothetical protein ACLP8A_12270 [Methylovirgula sp.]